MYITEISEKDFLQLKLNLRKKSLFPSLSERRGDQPEKIYTNEEILNEFAKFQIEVCTSDYLTAAVFIHKTFEEWDVKGKDSDGYYWDKYACPEPQTFVCYGGVKHIHQDRYRFIPKGEGIFFPIRKDETAAVYFVHIDPKRIQYNPTERKRKDFLKENVHKDYWVLFTDDKGNFVFYEFKTEEELEDYVARLEEKYRTKIEEQGNDNIEPITITVHKPHQEAYIPIPNSLQRFDLKKSGIGQVTDGKITMDFIEGDGKDD